MFRAAGPWRILGRIAARAGMVAVLVVFSVLLLGLVDWTFMAVAGGDIASVVVATALSLAVGMALGVVVEFVGALAFAVFFADLYAELRPGIGLPPTLIDGSPATREKRIGLGGALLGGAAGLAGLAVVFSFSLIGQLGLDHSVKVTAHRGASKAAPENTLAALRRAVSHGADYAEIDVQRTADGVVVLLHDTDLRRVAGENANIWELTLEEIQRLDVGNWFSADFAGERVPTLAEAIAAVDGQMRLNIELKVNGRDSGLAAEVARVLRKTECGEACVVSSLDYGVMREIAQYDPNLGRGLILTASIGDPSRFEVDFLAVNERTVTRDLIDRAHRAGMEAHVWTVNDPDRMLTMIHLGVDNILTSRPDVLVALLRIRTEMSEAEKNLLLLADLATGRLWGARKADGNSTP